MKRILIKVGGARVEAELFDTETGREISSALPLEAALNTWGDEFYFEIPVSRGLDETATTSVKVGDIGYWPPGKALAIFFGPTPASTGAEPVPASRVNVVGRVLGDASSFRSEKNAGSITISNVEG